VLSVFPAIFPPIFVNYEDAEILEISSKLLKFIEENSLLLNT